MPERLPPTSGPAALPTAGRAARPVAATDATPKVAADALQLRPTPMIEADLRVAMRGGPAVDAAGTVKVQHGFVVRLVKDVLRDPRAFSGINVRHDPATGAYAASGNVRWLGIPWPIAMQARPLIIGDQLAVRFERPRLRLGPLEIPIGPMLGIAQDLVIAHMRQTRISAKPAADKATILIEPTSLLHEIGVLPHWITLDPSRTKLGLTTGPTGDLTVKLDSPTAPAAGASTPASDLVVAIDEAALQAVMARAVASTYDLKSLKLREDGVAVTGETDYKPVSDTLTAAKGILLLVALASGDGATLRNTNTSAVVVKGPLDLDVRVANGALLIKPSISLACGDMIKLMEEAGLPATLDRGVIKVVIADAERLFGADLRRLRIGPGGVDLQAGLDVERLIRNPRLLRD